MKSTTRLASLLALFLFIGLVSLCGCGAGIVAGGGGNGDMDDDPNGGNENEAPPEEDPVSVETYATNTGGASGLAVRPEDGALFVVDSDGIFGPVEDGDDLGDADPIGATNLAALDIFDLDTEPLVLAITESGEFWIGSRCCVTMGVVAPEGGDARAYLELLEGFDAININAETIAVVPDGFSGPQMQPGDVLVAEDAFSRMAAIDADGTEEATTVDNPAVIEDPDNGLIRYGHDISFGPDGTLYAATSGGSATQPNVQTVDEDGRPTLLAGTEGVNIVAFVVLDNGDLLIRGTVDPQDGPAVRGLLIYDASEQEIVTGLEFEQTELSGDDELVRDADGTIYMALPNLNEILVVTVNN